MCFNMLTWENILENFENESSWDGCMSTKSTFHDIVFASQLRVICNNQASFLRGIPQGMSSCLSLISIGRFQMTWHTSYTPRKVHRDAWDEGSGVSVILICAVPKGYNLEVTRCIIESFPKTNSWFNPSWWPSCTLQFTASTQMWDLFSTLTRICVGIKWYQVRLVLNHSLSRLSISFNSLENSTHRRNWRKRWRVRRNIGGRYFQFINRKGVLRIRTPP